MKFSDAHRAILAKIGVNSLLDLALVFPKSCDDLRVKNAPNKGENVVEICVKNLQTKPKFLLVDAFCKTWNCDIKIVIFNAKKWHYAVFSKNKTMFIHANADFVYDCWQFINPKIVTKIGEILPHFKRNLQDSTLKSLIQTYITQSNLLDEGLNLKEAKIILDLHCDEKKCIQTLANLQNEPYILNTLKFVEILNYIKKFRAKKMIFKAKSCQIYDISNWLKTLPFTPTNDQISAINDIRNDLSAQNAAKRVIMGDVGSGKTLIILASALMIYPKTAILMAPTTILCEQIYNEAKRLLPKFMNIKFLQKNEKKCDLNGVNFIIATHTLLYRDLPKANLIMVDEQHRFGSNQRLKINLLTKDGEFRAHFLQFSATPIPRTLGLIESELVNFSFLKQMPFVKKIHTFIIQNANFNELLNHLRSEISKHKQAIIVYPLVEESENFAYQSLEEAQNFWLKNFQNVFITHGKDKNKDEILANFRKNGDLLLATTIVEVGISLERLSTIVIVGAENLGLATLHQLRGRVARNGAEGWCFLYTKLKNIPQRLKDFAKTLDGFEVAQIDLKNRQSGDILNGTMQHGVTFEFYDMDENIAKEAKIRLANRSNL